jgi:N-acetylmuramoyl-L-alanine amidase CwlA
MSKYPITQDFLPDGLNHSGASLEPVGLTIHETATPTASAENESAYFHNGDRSASAHFFIDQDSIVQILPENLRAWHAGKQANTRFLSIEMCHFDDEERFAEVWARTVWLAADICVRYGLNPESDQLHTHAWVSETWGETDHTDPLSYFTAHGKTWADFVVNVVNEMEEISMAKLIDKHPNYYNYGVQAINDLAARGLLTGPAEHIETLKKADENSMDWLSLVINNRIAEKAGIKKA